MTAEQRMARKARRLEQEWTKFEAEMKEARAEAGDSLLAALELVIAGRGEEVEEELEMLAEACQEEEDSDPGRWELTEEEVDRLGWDPRSRRR